MCERRRRRTWQNKNSISECHQNISTKGECWLSQTIKPCECSERQQHLFQNVSILCADGVLDIHCDNINYPGTQTAGMCNDPFLVISE